MLRTATRLGLLLRFVWQNEAHTFLPLGRRGVRCERTGSVFFGEERS
jgi:hypothetical protein